MLAPTVFAEARERTAEMIDYEVTTGLRRVVRAMKEMMDSVTENSNAISALGYGELTMSGGRVTEMEMTQFALYLMASDGVIEDDEVKFFECVFDMSVTAEDLKGLIIDYDIYSTEFEQRPPLCFRLAAYAEVFYKANGVEDFEVMDSLIDGWFTFGKLLIASDDDIADSEVDDLTTYISMLRDSVPELLRDARMALI